MHTSYESHFPGYPLNRQLKGDPESPNIDCLGYLRTGLGNICVAKFWSKECRCSNSLGELDVSLVKCDIPFLIDTLPEITDSEVRDLYSVFFVPEQVGGLDIAVDEVARVDVLDARDLLTISISAHTQRGEHVRVGQRGAGRS